MNDEKNLVYRCYLDGVPVLDIYQDGTCQLNDDVPESVKQSRRARNVVEETLSNGGTFETLVEAVREGFEGDKETSNAETLKKFVASFQEFANPVFAIEANGTIYRESDDKYAAAFATLQDYGFSPNVVKSTLRGDPKVEFFGEGEPWIDVYEYDRRHGKPRVIYN